MQISSPPVHKKPVWQWIWSCSPLKKIIIQFKIIEDTLGNGDNIYNRPYLISLSRLATKNNNLFLTLLFSHLKTTTKLLWNVSVFGRITTHPGGHLTFLPQIGEKCDRSFRQGKAKQAIEIEIEDGEESCASRTYICRFNCDISTTLAGDIIAFFSRQDTLRCGWWEISLFCAKLVLFSEHPSTAEC
jgi:hypothetical protein